MPTNATDGSGLRDRNVPIRKRPKDNKHSTYTPPPESLDPEIDTFSANALSDIIDRSLRAWTSRFTNGVAPLALSQIWFDWATHLSAAPGKRMLLAQKAVRKTSRLARYAMASALEEGAAEPCISPLPQDHRFNDESWQEPPYNLIYQSFLLTQQWWHNATTGIRGLSSHDEQVASFITRQILDTYSPSNFPWLNPEVLKRAKETNGANFLRGWKNFMEDAELAIASKAPAIAEEFKVGEGLAITPGKIVFRNHLIELIQYEPQTASVRPQPILFVPAWIMKYYVLDLSPHNSLVKYMVEQGFTVFMISWRNPTPEDRDLGIEEYRRLGLMEALDVVQEITGADRVHTAGYCLGGTLLSIAAAAMARDGDDRLASVTLLAAQTDFSEAGELLLFIGENQVSFLEDMMWEQGFLDARQMSGAFQLLRSNDLLWSRYMREYLMGERAEMFDLMAWNTDTTRMPFRMHSEYLRKLYMGNELAGGRFTVKGSPIALKDISVPIFAVGADEDHIAPWRSVFKIHLFVESEVTFVLTNGGHNGGIVSEPGHKQRHYLIGTSAPLDVYEDPDTWRYAANEKIGSWWQEWSRWLAEHSGEATSPPHIGAPESGLPLIGDAPGTYVKMK